MLGLTASKLPATGSGILKSLKNHTQDTRILEILDALIDYKAVDKILTAFIPALKMPDKDQMVGIISLVI